MYKKILDVMTGQEAKLIKRMIDGAVIPFDPDNTDYQTYLKWVAEGNTPLPAEEA